MKKEEEEEGFRLHHQKYAHIFQFLQTKTKQGHPEDFNIEFIAEKRSSGCCSH